MAATPPAPARATAAVPFTQRRWWPWVKRVGTWIFFALIATLLVQQARGIDWDDVLDAFSKLPLRTLGMAAALAASSFALYSTYDLLGRRVTGHRLGTGAV